MSRRTPIVRIRDEPKAAGGDPRYAAKRVGKAIRELATHPGTLEERLRAAAAEMRGAMPADFPAAVRQEFVSLQGLLRGDVAVGRSRSLYSANWRTQVKIATRLYDLHLGLEAHTGSLGPTIKES